MSQVFSYLKIEASVCDEIAGYIVTYPDGGRLFHHTLEAALTRIATDLTGQEQLVMVL